MWFDQHSHVIRGQQRCQRWRRIVAFILAGFACATFLHPYTSVSGSTALATPPAFGANDLLVIGAGHLGHRIAKTWLAGNPDARVVGATLTDAWHDRLRAAGIEARTISELRQGELRDSFPYVVFSVPPRTRSNPDPNAYIEAVKDALAHWPPNVRAQGCFVFTSSGGVLSEDEGATVNEMSPVSDSPGSQVLLNAEECVLAAGGTVLRLAGLYDVKRGGHAYWMQAGTVKGNPEGFINLINYDDASEAAIAALTHGSDVHGELILISDGAPMTRRAIVEAAHAAPPFSGMSMPAFEAGSDGAAAAGSASAGHGGLGKVYDIGRARTLLKWKPRYSSFAKFIASQT